MGSGEGGEEPAEASCLRRGGGHRLPRSAGHNFPDPAHSDEQEREITIGHSLKQRVIFVSRSRRGERRWIIGARKATRTILPNITIGKNVFLGAGTVVTKDVPHGKTMMGIPAKEIVKNIKSDRNNP